MVKLLLLVFLFSPAIAISATVFEDNFDSQSDWTASVEECGVDCSDPPSNWTYYRSTGNWESDDGGEDTISISSTNARGGTGKAFTVWNESREGQSGWGADGMISVLLDADYPELYIELYIKYDPTWQASTTDNMMIKMFRAEHYDRSGNPFQFFNEGNFGPMYLYYPKNSNTYGTRVMNSFRCDPQYTEYYCENNDEMVEETDFDASLYADMYEPRIGDPHSYNDDGMFADGEWHKHSWHVKVNTYAGSGVWNSDGVVQMWIDDVLVTDVSHMRWIESGTDSSVGWNIISLGGNAYNLYSAESNEDEQFYAMDDLVISTTPINDSNITCYPDIDNDLYPGTGSESVTTCSTNWYIASHFTSMASDCDDTDEDINPGLGNCGSVIGGNSSFQNIGTGNSQIRFR